MALMNTLVACLKCGKLNRVPLERAATRKAICGNCKSALTIHDGVQDINDKALNKLIQNAAQQLGEKYIFAKLNTENYPDLSKKFQIRGIPTLVIFKNGKELDRQSGGMQLPMFLSYLNRWIQ